MWLIVIYCLYSFCVWIYFIVLPQTFRSNNAFEHLFEVGL